jgi:sulfur-oxidizing protein SoxY
MRFSRRSFVSGTAASAALVILPIPVAALDLSDDVAAHIDDILDGRDPREGGIELEAPAVAENGAQVPLTIRVDSPMSEDDHVTAIHIIATANPAPGIGSFHLTPHLTRAEVFTRIRLAEEQEYLVIAELSDGSVLQAAARTAVTQGGCVT